MADTKISALPASTTPLAGTETLPIVQSGVTKKVSVADLTAGRAVASAGGTFSDNLTQGTAGKGVNFTANTPAAGMTSQLLNWYEEGTWTPTFTNFGTTNLLFAKYTRIGRAVAINLRFEVTAATANSSYFTLPFNSSQITSGTWVRNTVEGGFVEVNAGANCYFASTPSSTSGAFAISTTYFV